MSEPLDGRPAWWQGYTERLEDGQTRVRIMFRDRPMAVVILDARANIEGELPGIARALLNGDRRQVTARADRG